MAGSESPQDSTDKAASSDIDPPSKPNKWDRSAPWFLTIASTAVLGLIVYFLLENIAWFKSQMLASAAWSYDGFQVHMYHLHNSLIKRSIGIFAGFSALFLGLAVSFYTVKESIRLKIGDKVSVPVALATNSPGIAAMVLGVYLIQATIESKDSFERYIPEIVAEKIPPHLAKEDGENKKYIEPKTQSGFRR